MHTLTRMYADELVLVERFILMSLKSMKCLRGSHKYLRTDICYVYRCAFALSLSLHREQHNYLVKIGRLICSVGEATATVTSAAVCVSVCF